MPLPIILHNTPLIQGRFPIRDRAHARQIVQQLAFGDMFRSGQTAEGFADWLFLHRRTFNGANPLQQAKMYVSSYRAAQRRGVDLDAECHAQANEKEQLEERVRAIFEADLAAIKACWAETPVGADITLAIAELHLGRGHRFAASPDGASPQDSPLPWVLQWLLELLEEFGGPDYLLHEYDWMHLSSENYFLRQIDKRDKAMTTIRKKLSRGEPLSELDFVCLAIAAKILSSLLRVRTTLRTLLTEVQMVERIGARTPADADTSPPPTRRRRLV